MSAECNLIDNMREVSRDEFFQTVGVLDVLPEPWPFWSVWKLRNGRIVGVSFPGYKFPGNAKKYFICKGV